MSDTSQPQKPTDPDTPNPKLIITENKEGPKPESRPLPPPRETRDQGTPSNRQGSG